MLTGIRQLRVPMPMSANINGSRGGRYKVPPPPDGPLYKQRYRTTVHLYDRYLCADGTPTKKNADNVWKILADALGKAYGIDDSWLDWDTRLVKHDWAGGSEPYCVIDVEPLLGHA